MTRAARIPRPDRYLKALSERASKTGGRKMLAYTGAGLALAGAGAAIATAGLTGNTASASGHGSQHRGAAAVSSHSSPAAGQHAPASRARTHGAVSRQAAVAHATAHAAGHGAATVTGHAAASGRARHAGTSARHVKTWAAVSRIVAGQTFPKATGHGRLPAQDRLTPAGTSGPQSWLPITSARYDNAKAIVSQALAKHMGARAAVVALATSMQESGLLNVNYGTSDSLGLFQQRPSMGWGTASQIMHPAYAADAFLNALRGYEARNPGWARQPLWQPAQGVQASAYPYAYAKWEAQAAHLVAVIAPHLV